MKPKKKILIFSLAYYPKFVGGAEVAIKEITDRIDPEEIEFHMVTLRFDKTLPLIEKVGNVLVHRIGFSKSNPTPQDLVRFPLHLNKYFFQFFAAKRAHLLHAEHSYDAVWGMMAHATAVPLALFSLSHSKIPLILSLQEGDDLKRIERIAKPVWPLFTRAFTRASRVQCISSYLRDWAVSLGASEEALVTIPNGVHIEGFSREYSMAEIETLRRKLGLVSSDVTLITTSRLVKKNGIDVVIRSLRFMKYTTHFLIVGTGPEEQALRVLAEKEGVASRVHFLGHMDHEEIPKYLSASSIFVRPSRSEGMGNSFIEAMATGLPVIGTQEGGLQDIIFDATRDPEREPTGWAVDTEDPQAIARAVEEILTFPEKTDATVKNAWNMIRGDFEWDTIASRMELEVFSKL